MKNINLLLLDDSEADRGLLKNLVKKCDLSLNIYEADSFDSGLKAINEEKIDILFLDYRLSDGQDGISIIKKIRSDEKYLNLYIVLITALSDENLILDALKNGADDYLNKDGLSKIDILRTFGLFNEKTERKIAESIVKTLNSKKLINKDAKIFLEKINEYQVELEMQNDELQKVNSELQKVSEKYLNLYHKSPVGYLTLSEQGVILENNSKTQDLMDLSSIKARDKFLINFLHKDDQPKFLSQLKRAFETKASQTGELRLAGGDSESWIKLELKVDNMSGGELRCFAAVSDITNIKKAEGQLTESEEKFKLITELSTDFFYKIRQDQNHKFFVEEISEGLEKLSGFSKKDLDTPEKWEKLVVKEDFPSLMRFFEEVISSGDSKTSMKAKTKSGEIIEIDMAASRVLDKDGNLDYILGFGTDITERKKAEEELTVFKNFVKNSKQGLGWARSDGSIEYINQSLSTMVEESFDNALNKSVSRYYDEETQKKLTSEIFPKVFSEGSCEVELNLKGLNGKVTPTQNHLFAIKGDDGELKYIGNIVTDISERKKAEEALYETNSILQAALDNSQAGIAIANAPNGELRYVNKAGLMIRNRSEEEIVKDVDINKYVGSWKLLDLNGIPLKIEEVPLARAVMFGEKCSREFIVRRDDNEDRIVWANAAPIHNEKGDITAAIVIFLDITERKKAEEEKVEMQKKLFENSKLASLGQLSAGVAHEINNPLAILFANHDLILNSPLSKNKELGDFLNDNLEEIERIKTIVDDLNEFARVEKDDKKPQFNIHESIEKTVRLVKKVYEKENVKLNFRLKADSFLVSGSEGRFRQSLLNFITNAKDACSKKGGEILVETFSTNENLFIKVADNGHGIEKENLDKIFNTFFTTKDPGEGTGLGLSLAHSYIKEMNGDVSVESTPEVGTTFTLSFPFSSSSSKSHKGNESKNSNKSSKLKVLIVDDEKKYRRVLRLNIERLGGKIQEAEDGLKAYDILKKESFDVVFLDLKMPKMSGDELLKKIIDEKLDVKKIVVLTGLLLSEYEGNNLDILKMANKVLRKPVTFDEISSAIYE